MLTLTKADWIVSTIFCIVFGLIVLIPCVIIALYGRKTINRMGQNPSQIPAIQMETFVPLLIIGVVTFASLIAFYNVFSGK
ncbi:MAG: hypothetical protein KBD53_05785 [Candidatus Omnitrophica bacterium]|nr:hypothetical protein [Candidatus Omnitrophota bacterium]